jgi:hypothetical protein
MLNSAFKACARYGGSLIKWSLSICLIYALCFNYAPPTGVAYDLPPPPRGVLRIWKSGFEGGAVFLPSLRRKKKLVLGHWLSTS